MTAKREALQVRERIGVRLDAHIAFHRQISARRTIEEAHIRRDRPRLARPHRRRRVGRQIHRDALRNEVLDREVFAPDNADAIHFRRNPPRPARRSLRHREGIAYRAIVLARVLEPQPPRLDPVRSEHNDGPRAIAQRHRRGVADQRGDVGRLTRAIDAALGIDERIRRLRRRAPADIALAQVNRRTIKIEDREIAIRRIGHHHARRDIALALHDRAGEIHATRAVRIAAREDLVVPRHQFQLHAGHRLRRLQRPHRRRHAVNARVGGQRQIGDDQPALCPRCFAWNVA